MIRFFARHPTAANLFMIVFLFAGAMSVQSLRRETFPDYSEDKVEVRVVYAGATAEDVEDAICRRIEDAVDGVNYVAEVVSEARESVGVVVVEMEEGGDIRAFLEDIKTEVEAIDDFPDQAESPVVKELNRTDQVVSVAVGGPMSATDLKAYCEDLKERLKQEAGVSLVEIKGFSERQIRIEIPSETLMQYGVSMAEVADTIAGQSVDLPAGSLETRERDILVRFADERRTVEQFRDLVVVAGENGAEIRLGEIATIVDLFELAEQKYVFDGRRSGMLEIAKTKSEDTLDVFDAVESFVEKERRIAPPGVRLVLTQDISSIVRDRLSMLVKNGWQGLLLVFFTMWLFFSLRLSFWVVMGLPVSFLGAFFFMPHMEYSLNMLTMVGLLIGLGLLMDDAIVIAENVSAHLEKGKSAFAAVTDGVSEVKNGVFASFVTTVCVFGPVSFLEGNIGKVLKVMPVVLILVITVSLVEAFCILPRHLAHSLRGREKASPGRFRKWFDAMLSKVRENALGRVVDLAVGWRYLTLGLAVGALAVSIAMVASGKLKFKPFPDIDGDTVQVRVLLPQGTPLSRTEAVAGRLTGALTKLDEEFAPRQPGGERLVRHVSVQYGANPDAYETGPHVATISADLLKAEIRDARVDEILNRWRELAGPVTDVVSLKFTEPAIGPQGRAIDIRIKGRDLDRMKDASRHMRNWLNQFEGVNDISDDLRPGKPEIRIRMAEGALGLGLDARMTAEQLRSAFYGKTAGEIQVGRDSFEIDVRLDEGDRNSLSDLANFHVTLPGGEQAPLDAVAVLEEDRGYARIASVDGLRTVTVQGDVDSRKANTAEIMAMMEKEFMPKFRDKFPDLVVSLEGEAKETAKTGGSLRRGFVIGVVGIFILLSFQFGSYVAPAVVMTAIPMAFIGVIWGHLLMGLDLCMPSMMGAVSLAGVVVNDSILLVEFIKIRRRQGQGVRDAARRASRERFRAVLLTSLTTVAGLLPLLAEKSLQAQILIPLAASIVFGLIASTVLVLVVVPSLYAILDDLGLAGEASL